jgi:hypothetical protein
MDVALRSILLAVPIRADMPRSAQFLELMNMRVNA